MHGAPRVPRGLDPVRRAIGHTDEAVPNMDPGIEVDLARLHRRENTDQNRDLDRAGGVKPLVSPMREREPGLVVVDGDGDCLRAGFGADSLDLLRELSVRRLLHAPRAEKDPRRGCVAPAVFRQKCARKRTRLSASTGWKSGWIRNMPRAEPAPVKPSGKGPRRGGVVAAPLTGGRVRRGTCPARNGYRTSPASGVLPLGTTSHEELSRMRVRQPPRRSWASMPLLALLAIPASLAAQVAPDPLTLEEAIALARENNPGYLSQASQIGAAEWGVRSAYASLLPTLSTSTGLGYTATGERRFDSVVLERQPAQLSSRYNIGLNLTLNGSTLLAPSVARANARAVEETADGAASTLEADVTQRYVTVLESLATIEQAERELARTAEHVRLAQARFDVGAGTAL